jgi:transcriptional regulator with XRE-family HTH domain
MITNDVQYRTAKAQADRLDRLLSELLERPNDTDNDLRRALESKAVESQLTDLRGQLVEYDALREGREPVGELATVDDLPRLLVRARIARGMSQRVLAERLGLKEQQIQRYESTDYASASLSRLREVAAAVELTRDEIPEGEITTSASLVRQLVNLGLDQDFVRRRIAPASLRDRRRKDPNGSSVIDLASRVGRVFGLDGSSLLAGDKIQPDHGVLAAASFKLPKGASADHIAAYTVYAHYVALLSLQASENIERQPLPSDAKSLRTAWHEPEAVGSFEGLVRMVWDFGIPVLPLADAGGFHAAVWQAGGREVIVLKQGARRASRWTFDLLHEVRHITLGIGENESGGIIDADDMSTDETEQQANQFAGDVLLDGRGEELVQLCVEEAKGSVERLKRVVPQVAAAQNVEVGALANYLAFRLSMQDLNWWGAASNLQSGTEDPWTICRDIFLERVDLGSLNPLDRELLTQALVSS